MTIALLCILLAAMMPIVCAGLVKGRDMTVPFKDGGYDNRNPRDWIAKQQGSKKWAQAAQENCWEALPFFAASVIVSHMLGVIGWLPNVLAVTFIVLRVIYIALYITGKERPRSLVWVAAFFVNVAIFLSPLLRG